MDKTIASPFLVFTQNAHIFFWKAWPDSQKPVNKNSCVNNVLALGAKFISYIKDIKRLFSTMYTHLAKKNSRMRKRKKKQTAISGVGNTGAGGGGGFTIKNIFLKTN